MLFRSPATSAAQARPQPSPRIQQESTRKQKDSSVTQQSPAQHQQSPRPISMSYATYEPLPLAQSPAPMQKESRKARPRASTVGSRGREEQTVTRAESPRDRERRIEQDFEALLVRIPSVLASQNH